MSNLNYLDKDVGIYFPLSPDKMEWHMSIQVHKYICSNKDYSYPSLNLSRCSILKISMAKRIWSIIYFATLIHLDIVWQFPKDCGTCKLSTRIHLDNFLMFPFCGHVVCFLGNGKWRIEKCVFQTVGVEDCFLLF